MLVRTDPAHHRIAYLSIPRDLLVPIPASATTKINAAIPVRRPGARDQDDPRSYTGLPINHVVVVDFAELQGPDRRARRHHGRRPEADPLEPVRLPVRDAGACQQWQGWRFPKGTQHMDGQRALIYSRIRENQLDPRETDFTRRRASRR